MFKKLSVAAALAGLAALSPAAYASAIGGAVEGVVDAGRDVADGVLDAGEDIVDGVTGGNNNTTSGSTGGTTSGTTSGDSSSSGDAASSEETASGSNSTENAAGNPGTGISLGYVASAAVLAAMGVVVTAVRRKD